jgi:hypothetical protein
MIGTDRSGEVGYGGYAECMSRESELLAALTSEPATTSEVYERIGYVTLTRLGLIPYPAFRQALAGLSASGLAQHDTAQDGSTVWWIPGEPSP